MLYRARVGVSIVSMVLIALVVCTTAEAQSKGIAFGVKPGLLPLQSAYVGMNSGRLQPYIGLDVVSASVEMTERYGEGEQNTDKISGTLFIPHLGSKLFLKPQNTEGEVAPYLLGAFLFSLASVDGGDGADTESEDYVKELLEFWGLSVAFGAEYSFSDRFAVGGEFGLRYLHDGAREPGDEEFADEISVAFAATYAALTLNFRI
jgi:hypothetical protein